MTAISGKHILIVEDDEDIVDLIIIVVGEDENQIDIAANGSIALAKVKANNNYDLIISDYHMPQMNGSRLFNEIRLINPTLADRIFFISGEPAGSEIGGFGNAKARFMLKPFGIKDLRQQIEAFFNEKSS